MPFSILWTYIQLIEMRLGAAELLRTIEHGSNLRHFSSDWWDLCLLWYGMPVPPNWDDVPDYEAFIIEYRERLFRGIDWHAFRGRYGPSNSRARLARIDQLTTSVEEDLRILRSEGINPHSPASGSYARAFFVPSSGRRVIHRRV